MQASVIPCFSPSYGPLWVRAARGKAGDDGAHETGGKVRAVGFRTAGAVRRSPARMTSKPATILAQCKAERVSAKSPLPPSCPFRP
ncbi:hypothetical protein SPHINGO391_410133 [Sphingomonas aurantiaca]|uniref:Uncharacterized protein n=1 Tax=Sphingomonas aurantiaca TaxID=185949 RepID=A0A5E7YZX9_9SPHN|nr:hypothetical protein SPHINGO391_410133 [Sphingomonas aurantiaca]